ncbi:MAG: pyridoxamine 5'-phosphate oxidase family protein [Chthonomonadaceae bacterium]|nr:pyridoxamine 5'-phosphate oxidase family protein [Chthonomonadaceae bacterium]
MRQKSSQLNGKVLCWLATVDPQGRPNVSPKEVFAQVGLDSWAVANIASPGTVANIRTNPAVCLAVVDIFTQRGNKYRGTATIVESSDADFPDLARPLAAIAGTAFPIKSVILIRITETEDILAPSYWLCSETTTEASQTVAALKTYGVKPLE